MASLLKLFTVLTTTLPSYNTLEKVDIHWYRCFEKLELSFKPEITLFVGDNASGKSTIIDALGSVFNSLFLGYSDQNTRFRGLDKDDFTQRESAVSTGLLNEEPICLNFWWLGKEARMYLESPKGSTRRKELEPISTFGKNLYSEQFDTSSPPKQVRDLPLVARYSTADIHTGRKISIEKFQEYRHKPSFGYYESLAGDGFLRYWTKRLLILKEAETGAIEIQGVRQALQETLGESGCGIINDMDIRHNRGKVYYHFTDGRKIDTDRLSDGYRRLVSIVMDIAFRCVILNQGVFSENACRETSGTVLIDEIDLHLHPSLQALVLPSLRRAFPRLQFIVTTHAPMVMSGVPNNDRNGIYYLQYTLQNGYTVKPIILHGMDASTILETGLDITPRSKDVDAELEKLFSAIDKNNLNEAREQLHTMRIKHGENLPDLAKAEAMLNFFDETE